MDKLRQAAEMALEVLEKQHNWMVANGGGEMFAIPSKKAINELRQALDETPPCKTHPDAPHGFDRNASHNADRYVCECESWEPIDLAKVGEVGVCGEETFTLDRGCYERGCVAYDERDGDGVNISAERVEETAKGEHEPVTAHQALEALDELESCSRGDEPFNHFAAPLIRQFIEQTLAQPEQTVGMDEYKRLQKLVTNQGIRLMEYESQPEHEPVGWYDSISGEIDFTSYKPLRKPSSPSAKWIPVYTAPPKREWVGLTDEEIYDYADKFLYSHGSNYGIRSFGKAIEAKLKEKNA